MFLVHMYHVYVASTNIPDVVSRTLISPTVANVVCYVPHPCCVYVNMAREKTHDPVSFLFSIAFGNSQRAVDAVLRLPPSEARDGLVNVCHIVLTRNK